MQEIDRVIDDSSAQTFIIRNVLLKDFSRSLFDPSGALEVTNPVPLYDSSMRKIGFANVYLVSDDLIADLFFEYSCPDRLTIQTEAFKLYAHPFGLMVPLDNNMINLDTFDTKARFPLLTLNVRSIYISPIRPKAHKWRETLSLSDYNHINSITQEK